MSHDIKIDDQMAYRVSGGHAWHGMGIPVEDNVTDAEFFRVSGLDWKVVRMPVLIQGKSENRAVEGWKALVRSTDAKVLGMCTDSYHPVQNTSIWKFFQQFCEAGDMTLETAGSLCGGTKVWALAKINGATFNVAGVGNGVKDTNNMYAAFSTGHTPGFATQVEITTIRVVCGNTLSIARNMGSEYRFSLSHRAQWSNIYAERAKDVIGKGLSGMRIYREKADRLATTKVSPSVEQAFLIELLQPDILRAAIEDRPKTLTELSVERGADVLNAIMHDTPQGHQDTGKIVLDSLVEYVDRGKAFRTTSRTTRNIHKLIRRQPGADMTMGTLWGTFNAVTNYVDHHRGRTPSSSVDSAMFGEGSTLKSKALDLAVEYSQRLGVG